MEVVKTNVSSIRPTHYGVAQFVHKLFKEQYKCNLVKKSPVWFEKQADGAWKKIDDIVIYKRLSTDVFDAVADVRVNFKTNPEFTEIQSIASNNKSLEALNHVLKALIEKKNAFRDANQVDEAREVEGQIRDAENSIELITKRQELHKADARDRVFSELVEVENKLCNSPFKIGVMKELIGFFYEATE